MKRNYFSKLFVLIFLLVLIIARSSLENELSDWISLICYSGILISLVDVFSSLISFVERNRAYYIIIIIIALIICGAVTVFALILCHVIKPDNKANDLFTLITLAISLPKELYLNIARIIIQNDNN